LLEMFSGYRSFKEIKNLPVIDYFMNLLSWDEQKFVKDMTPERLELPAGRKIRLSYKPGEVPRGNGFIQDFYGLDETPSVAGGRVKIVLELLAPNRRIVHITDDLEGFWSGVYLDIKSQLAGRYPKHKWI
jgi:ATP-dependent helicase HrpB